jgi:hypothetical protein
MHQVPHTRQMTATSSLSKLQLRVWGRYKRQVQILVAGTIAFQAECYMYLPPSCKARHLYTPDEAMCLTLVANLMEGVVGGSLKRFWISEICNMASGLGGLV